MTFDDRSGEACWLAMVDELGDDPRTTLGPIVAVEELLRSVPRLVDRTVRQAELIRSLAAHIPCVGPLLAPRRIDPASGAVTPEPTSVLDLFDEEPEDEPTPVTPPAPSATATVVPAAATTTTATTPPATNGHSAAPIPLEADLAVPDYDSLAASQVVPRLAMLSSADLRAVLAYEQSHRHRQTILNRVTQLLEA